MIVKPFELDKTKVKRIFTFGCSFTNYAWPTWANIVAKELENAELYNLGLLGLGNLAISAKVSEAHYRFNFSESDLVMILWSTFLREDRWINGRWFGAGNVFSTGMYDREFCDKYADVSGYLIRDCALISMTKQFLHNLPCQAILMPSVPLDYKDSEKIQYNDTHDKIIELYQPLFSSMPISLYDHIKIDGKIWPITHNYYWDLLGKTHNDNHPSPYNAFDYLRKNVLELSSHTEQYAISTTEKLLSLSDYADIVKEFEYDTKEYLLF